MTTFKVSLQQFSRYGDKQWVFDDPATGKKYLFPYMGSTWTWSDDQQGWVKKDPICQANNLGLVRIVGKKAIPFVLADGEKFLTPKQVGPRCFLKSLPK